jgi:uncharacterized protein (TIGR03032 family)
MLPGNAAAAKCPERLRSVHTSNFPDLLRQLGISLLVTTYQAGKLAILRAEEDRINTHFRDFPSPMGLAVDRNRLAIGTPTQVWEFHNVSAVTAKLEPDGRHDACFLPRSAHITGNILVHEMAWAANGPGSGAWNSGAGEFLTPGPKPSAPELWIVNTRFSCLCTLDHEHSFVPRWRPKFITALAPEDRCHLNGLALAPRFLSPGGKGQGEGELVPRFVTAHAASDVPAGWRADKAHGGILMDVSTNEILVRGLAMPHSPRWYANKLWVLESGTGTIGVVDRTTGRYESIAPLPGFTRGLDFFGPYAFIGLSQVRENAVFSGIPITERPLERNCGVWMLDIRTGQTVAFLKFEEALQEIFAVQVLPGMRYPDLLNDNQALIGDSFVLPEEALKDVPVVLFRPGETARQEQLTP